MPVRKNNFNPERVRIVTEFRRRHPEAGAPAIAAATGLPDSSIGRILRMLRAAGETPESPLQPKDRRDPIPEERGIRYDADANLIVDVAENPRTVDQLLDACRIDRKRWRVARVIANKWEVGAKDARKLVRVTPLYQIKVYLEPMPGLKEADAIREAIEWVRKQSLVARRVPLIPRKVAVDDPVMLEVSIPDAHYGKLAWHEETGEDYDTKIAGSRYLQANRELWAKASVYPVEKILIVIGNDYFNVNDSSNATAAGTPQSEDDRWSKTFRRGVAILREQIEFFRGKAPEIEVRVIRGNHDSERIFMAGEVLRAMYEKCPDVKVVNDPIKRQYVQWGTVLLGLTHGDRIKLDKLPLLMAGEAPQLWAATTHREIHLGHFHHKRETQYHVGTEQNAVRVRVLPSLTTADEWHYDNGYVGARQAAEAYLWAKKAGYLAHVSWSPSK